MRSHRLQNALGTLQKAIAEVEAAVEEVRAEQDPLAMHIFASRRRYRCIGDRCVKSGHRAETESTHELANGLRSWLSRKPW
jgi:hypothetical protein